MSDDRRALLHLKKIPMFNSLSAEELEALARDVTLQEARKRRVIYMSGDPGQTIFFVASGRVKVSRITPDGKELTLSYCGPGEFFGDASLLDRGAREEMVEVTENALVMEFTADILERLIKTHTDLAYQMTRLLCERRRALERKMEDLLFKDVGAKLAELLIGLRDEYGVDDKRGTLVAFKITHQEMANLIGATRETVSLTLAQFKKNKLITTLGRKVIITNLEGLQALL